MNTHPVIDQKIRLIHNVDEGAGFTALMVYALNGVRKAVENNELPVVNYDKKTTLHFYEPTIGENIWEYFFEPVASVSYEQLKKYLNENLIGEQDILQYSSKEIYHTHLKDKGRLATFWAMEEPGDKVEFMTEKRALGRTFVKKYIRVKPTILQKVEAFRQEKFKAKFIIGVHIRGTDFAYAKPTSIDQYFESIDAFIQDKKLKEYQVFLATDQEQYVVLFKEKYGDKVITYEALRSKNDVSPFQFKNASGYKKGEDVLIDILLLSSSQYLFKSAAAVGEMALWFNDELSCTDFALESQFENAKFYQLKSTYLKLNVDKKSRISLLMRDVFIKTVNFCYQNPPFIQILKAYNHFRK